MILGSFGLCFLFVLNFASNQLGYGHPKAKSELQYHNVYRLIDSPVVVSEGGQTEYWCVLKNDQHGNIHIYNLDLVPPSLFSVTQDYHTKAMTFVPLADFVGPRAAEKEE